MKYVPLLMLLVTVHYNNNVCSYQICSNRIGIYNNLHQKSCRYDTRTTNTISTIRYPPTQLYFFKFGNQDDSNNKKEDEQVTTTIDDKDPVEKIFNFFFGEPEAEPLGLKRFGKDRFPEQYPATTTEWANPVIGDTPEIAKFRPVLKNTNFEYRKLRITYDANRDGWDANKFHKKVDKLGPGLVVATTTSGLVVGGYNPKGWVGYGEARGSIAAFLFRSSTTVPNTTNEWIKLRKVGGASMAQIDNPESGPMFGADSLIIPLQRGSNAKVARSKLGSYYERMDNGSTNSLFGKDTPTVQLRDLKVYHGIYEPDEYIPFTDAEPLALY